MFKATREIYETLKKRENLKVFTTDHEDQSEVWLQFGIKNGGSYRIKFISKDDDNDVAVRVFALIEEVDEQHRAAICKVLNELNVEYRYVKFCCDSDGDVNIEYDYPVRCSDPAASAEEIVIRFAKIIDDVYPRLMKAMWA